MASLTFKLVLNSANFPFLYDAAGRGVLMPELDISNRMPGGFSGGRESQDFNTIQPLYLENILPAAEGLLSVGIAPEIPAISPAQTDFDKLIIIRDAQENIFLFSPARGKNYVYDATANTWVSRNPFTFLSGLSLVTHAYVNGVTYIFYEATKGITWNVTLSQFDNVTFTWPTGYTTADIRGICPASNYLIAHTETEILWSSLTNNTNFADLIGGAGRQTPVDLRGRITCCLPIAGGFIIYTLRNAVAAYFTNNPAAPFLFKEIPKAGGVAGPEQVSYEANNTHHYTIGASGIQRVALDAADTYLPAAADFLKAKAYNLWNDITDEIELIKSVQAFAAKIQYVQSRYLIISFAPDNDGHFQLALFYDEVLDRWGRVRELHADAFSLPVELGLSYYTYAALMNASYQDLGVSTYLELNSTVTTASLLQTSIGFLKKSGEITLLITDPSALVSEGIAVIGHIQLRRSRNVTVTEVEADFTLTDDPPDAFLLVSEDGKNRQAAIPMYKIGDQNTAVYQSRITGKNIDLMFRGRFLLTSAIVTAVMHGKR
jgi:hypothetical protein